MAKEGRAAMSPLEDLFRTRTNRDRLGTIPNESDDVLLMRDLDSLSGQGLIKRMPNILEISADSREKTFFQEIASGELYVYVERWDRGAPEFRRHSEPSFERKSHLEQ
jgi:hypothetical protein